MRMFRATLLAMIVVVSTTSSAMATHQIFNEAVFNDTNNDGVADGWTDVNSFDMEFSSGEYNLDVDPTTRRQIIRIETVADNIGNAGIAKTFPTTPKQGYTAAATVQISNVMGPADFWARLTIQPRSGGSAMLGHECNTLIRASRDYGTTVEPPLEVLEIPRCIMPSLADELRIKIRAQINSPASSGTIIVHEASFAHLPYIGVE